jgi:hypothetical protein
MPQPASGGILNVSFAGFMHEAKLDEGAMWLTAFALKALTAAEARIGAREESGELRTE